MDRFFIAIVLAICGFFPPTQAEDLQQQHQAKLMSFFPEKVGNFRANPGKSFSFEGTSEVKRMYSNGPSKIIVTLTSAPGNPSTINKNAAFGQIAAEITGGAQEDIRIGENSAHLSITNKNPDGSVDVDLSVLLEGYNLLRFNGLSVSDAQTVRTFADEFELSKFNNYFKAFP